jgi:hypothetical protein
MNSIPRVEGNPFHEKHAHAVSDEFQKEGE